MTSLYLLPGLEVAEMRGGEAAFNRVMAELTKETPSHVSIVGPRYFGKSVLMHRLARALMSEGSPFRIVCLWDLRHGTPVDDSDFVRQLARRIDDVLLGQGNTSYHEYLASPEASFADISDNLKLVIASLDAESIRVAVLLDDFDRLGQQSATTANLWNYLRGLAQHRNLRFVTSSRRRLRDVIAGKESRASDFWNIFGDPIVLRPHALADLDSWFEPLKARGFSLDDAAGREVLLCTGGVPVLLAILLGEIAVDGAPRRIGKLDIETVATAVIDKAQDFLQELWDDCSVETQRDLCDLGQDHQLTGALPAPRRDALLTRGYCAVEGAQIKPICRLMERFSASKEAAAAELSDWFKDPASELRTLKRILLLKLDGVQGGDPDLRHDLKIAIDSIEPGRRAPLRFFRGIAQQAVTIAWDAEFPGGLVPAGVQAALTTPQENAVIKALASQHEYASRRTILRRAIGGNQQPQKLTKKLTRPAMLLIDHLHNLGNYGQHERDFAPEVERPVDDVSCACFCLSAVLLFQRLTEDLA